MFSGTETFAFEGFFWGGVGSGVHCLFYKQENCQIQNTYIRNCQSDFLQLFLSDIICPIWLKEMCQMHMMQKKQLQRACSIHIHNVKTTSVLKHYLNAFLPSSLLKFVQNPRYNNTSSIIYFNLDTCKISFLIELYF